MLWLRSCPRCSGDMLLDAIDERRWCLQCGHYDYQPISAAAAADSLLKEKGVRRQGDATLREVRARQKAGAS